MYMYLSDTTVNFKGVTRKWKNYKGILSSASV